MAINAGIPLTVQPVQPPDQMNMLAKVLAIKDAQQNQQVNALKMQEYERGISESNALNAAYKDALGADGAVDRNRLYSTLATQNLGSRIPGLQKQFLEADEAAAKLGKTKAETGKIDFDIGIQRAAHVASVMSTARDQASYDLARQQLAQAFGPQHVAGMPAQFDPGVVQTVIAQGQTIAQRLSDLRAQQEQGERVRHNQATEANAAGQLQVARGNLNLRGQELEQARSQPRGQFIETTNGYVLADPKTGAVRPVTGADGQPLRGKAAERVLTDSQAKANLFGTRMKESDRILTDLEGKYSPMAVNAKVAAGDAPVIGGLAGAVGNAMLTTEGQQAEQAQRDFINAVLRRESGAVINPNEFENAKKQYFPQPNDDAKTLAQKRRNRELAIRGMEAEVPGGFRGTPSLTGTGQNGGASGGWSIQKVN